MNTRKLFLIFLLSFSFMLALAGVAYAHGVVINYTVNETTGELEFEALFDNGEALANAQVTIYAPADPATPWLTAKADENGRFAFAPDQVGQWDVQFRVAGHGDIVHINIEEIFEPPALEANSDESASETVVDTAAAPAQEASDTAAEETQDEMQHNMMAMDHDEASTMDEPTAAEAPEVVGATESQVDTAESSTAEESAAAEQPTSRRIVVSQSTSSSGTGGFTVSQILLMSASVIWGFVGTALYFQSKRAN
ncbi:MAG: hypothetical protein KDJ65_08390 [Anaerolineae bacterium]|nr:hypothetical protein [Anaerolineae bacterium]